MLVTVIRYLPVSGRGRGRAFAVGWSTDAKGRKVHVRVVVVGATGNVGTSLLRTLGQDTDVESILGLARRVPGSPFPKTSWAQADVTESDLAAHFRAADVVVHLAWLIQPSRSLGTLYNANVVGSKRVFDAAGQAGVRALVYASSVGAYSPGPKMSAVNESWPTDGVPTSFYSRHKAEVERLLDAFENEHPEMRVVRLRPGLIFKRGAGAEVRRLFTGPLLPSAFLRRSLIPVVPDIQRLRFQCVHSHDAGEAYKLAVTKDVHGAFNIAAEPVLDPQRLAALLQAAPVRTSPRLARALASATWRLHLQPTPPGWLDLALQSPVMDTSKARQELGWVPKYTSEAALLDLLTGLRERAGVPTPPLERAAGGRIRSRELST
ncbi:MAG: NAD-dependent epimerase/dehydratase family protein [Actinomycetota bacterium]|nr:NAD-dependent epimerase/dehydratase family protein [Actinomycetota bacterium]